MRKYIFSALLVSLLCMNASYSEVYNQPTTSDDEVIAADGISGGIDKTAHESRNLILGEEPSDSETPKTETKDEPKTETKDETVKDDGSKDEESENPFENAKVTEEAEAEEEGDKISDVKTAEACGIDGIAEGFPKDGKVAGTGGDYLRLRSWPWGNVIRSYPEGTGVKVLGVSGEFYLVEVDGTQGYMHKAYISTDDEAASGKAPYYPGSTRSGGALSLEEGVKASDDGAAGKVPSVTGGTPGQVNITADKVDLEVPLINQMTANTPAPGSSCGPTSLAMCLSFLGKGDANVLVTDCYTKAGCTASDGTGEWGLESCAKQYGFSNATWNYGIGADFCRQKLQSGSPLLCHVAHHYVVMKGIDSNNNVLINDPAGGVLKTLSWSDWVAWWNQGTGAAMSF